MNREVDKEEFWANRIVEAENQNDLRLSVYETSKEDWEEICKAHEKIIRETIKGKVLDAGCGFGRASEWVDGDYVGVDFSRDFISRARNLYPNRKFFVHDLSKELPFPDGHFDWAICLSMKEMIERELSKNHWETMLKNIKKVAKQVLILEYSKRDKIEIL